MILLNIVGSCFKILSEELSWEDARDQCMLLDKRSNLASITSNEENEYVKSKLIIHSINYL